MMPRKRIRLSRKLPQKPPKRSVQFEQPLKRPSHSSKVKSRSRSKLNPVRKLPKKLALTASESLAQSLYRSLTIKEQSKPKMTTDLIHNRLDLPRARRSFFSLDRPHRFCDIGGEEEQENQSWASNINLG